MIDYLFDGAFGTYIFSKDNKISSPESANITEPNLVSEIHNEYIKAGATAIKTNTFGVNKVNFSETSCQEIINAGYKIAYNSAKGKDVSVFADIGPIDCEDAEEENIRIANIFIEAGAKNFIFETQHNIESLKGVIKYIKKKVEASCVIVSFGVGQDGFSKSGVFVEELLNEAVIAGADYVGVNCICGPTHILKLLKTIDVSKYNLCVMPNTGYPIEISNRMSYYVDNPEYFTEKMKEICSLGVKVVGACCGSNPKYIKLMSEMLKKNPITITTHEHKDSTSNVKKRSLSEKFIAVELDSPVKANIESVLESARKIKECNVDFITIPDSPLGRTRASSMMISSLIKREVGVEVIPHLTCRDRNHIAIKGDLIAANIDGISNVLAITGDPIMHTMHEETKSVFSLNSFKLISFIKSLNEQLFNENPFNISGALNIGSRNFDVELKRAQKKIDSGVECLFTQPIFSEKDLENYFLARKTLNCKIAVGIMPPVSYRNAVFLNNEVPSINIPHEVIERLKDASTEEVKEICLDYTKNIIDKIGDEYDGYYIMTQLNKVELAVELVKHIKKN